MLGCGDDDAAPAAPAEGGAPEAASDASATAPNVCAEAGDLVYAFEAPGDCFRYQVDPLSVPAGFGDGGPAFRLVADSVTIDMEHKQRLYLLRSKVGLTEDYLVSPASDEDSAKYQLVGALSSAYYGAPQRPPGTIEVRRYVRTTPKLRHRLFVEGDGQDAGDWKYDDKTYFVCPPR